MEPDEIGKRVRYWRLRRHMSRGEFAQRVGRSASWVDKVETGERALARLPLLERVADVLGVSVDVLTHREAATDSVRCIDAVELAMIRSAIQRVEAVTGIYQSPNTPTEPNLPRLRQQVRYVWTAFQNAHYSILGAQLPRLLIDAQTAVSETSDQQRTEARTVLSLAYQVTASTMWKLSESDLGWIAAERGFQHAERTGDPVLISDAARRMAHGLMATRLYGPALALLRADIDRLEPLAATTADPAVLSVYGMLPLMGAVVASRTDDERSARELLAAGSATAARLGADRNERWTAFGPTNAALHTVSVLVDLGAEAEAVAVAQTVDPHGLEMLPRERRACHFVDVARAETARGHRREALDMLLDADRLAPEEVACRPVGRDVLSSLSGNWPGRPPADLTRMAARAGLPT
jgi:transcriptional regulator with XRE-family HTH domain